VDGRVRPWKARSSVILGMSRLDGCGLSESWIQKTCGEVHWRGLAVNQGCTASANSRALKGDSSLGLSTTVQPAASAGPTLAVI